MLRYDEILMEICGNSTSKQSPIISVIICTLPLCVQAQMAAARSRVTIRSMVSIDADSYFFLVEGRRVQMPTPMN